MAISINNFVNINTTYPTAAIGVRSFGGLVFSDADSIQKKSEGDSTAGDSPVGINQLAANYDNGEVVKLSLTDVAAVFGVESREYKFAEGYYSYVSPSGRLSSMLQFAKVLSSEETKVASLKRVLTKAVTFGSFTFLVEDGGDADLISVATYAASKNLNGHYLFVVNDVKGSQTVSDISSKCLAYSNIAGVCFVSGHDIWSGYMPMAILASTDYNEGTVTSFMFKQFAKEVPTVSGDETYRLFNLSYTNFYGRTQVNGQTVDFYQRGFNTDGNETSIYCNEMWFLSTCETALMGELLSRERLSADQEGVAQVSLIVNSQCSRGVNNGMFARKELAASEIGRLREFVLGAGGTNSNLEDVVTSLSTVGYSVFTYLDFSTDSDDGRISPKGEFYIKYYVFYGTADSVRYIKGNDILIK